MPTPCRIVLVTCASLPEAKKIAHAVVRKHLAACVNIHTAPIESIYRWKGKVETAREHLLLIKTTTRRLKALEREVLRLHSYDTPEFISLPISSGSRAYLRWLSSSL
ncbi:MAG TPA: divalent-cation tolerance protein CutA [Candidatus Eisenbacteria bacterium]|nr:divalent-cation tolerance protein CutA [Candidatus Eisenbacteria bacterium]